MSGFGTGVQHCCRDVVHVGPDACFSGPCEVFGHDGLPLMRLESHGDQSGLRNCDLLDLSLGSLGKGVKILWVASTSEDDADVGAAMVRADFVQEEDKMRTEAVGQ